MIRLDDLTILVLAVDNGSLSAVTRALNIAPAAANAAVKRLEVEPGVRLLMRPTRSLAFTQEGKRYLQCARRALTNSQVEQGAFVLGHQTAGGDVSPSIPLDLGRNVLTGWPDDFPTEHPAVVLQVHIGDRLVDMFRQCIDATVRYGELENSSLMALPLAPDNHYVLCAVPACFMRYSVPRTPDDLRRHNCLLLALSDTTYDQWTLHGVSDGGQAHVVRVVGNRITNGGELVRRRAVAGYGIAYKSRLDVLADLRANRLQAVLTDWRSEAAPLYLIYTRRLASSLTLIWLRDSL